MKRVVKKGGQTKKVSGGNLTEEQRLTIFAELEDLMFAQGMHKDAALDVICDKYKCTKKRAKEWMSIMLKQWRDSIDSEDLSERHYQLDRMAHHLYSEAMQGMSWGKARAKIEEVIRLVNQDKKEDAVKILNEMQQSRIPDLRIAQRVLWNLCAVSGYGNKVTVDVSGTGGLTLTPAPGR
jgi:hypothetical protein